MNHLKFAGKPCIVAIVATAHRAGLLRTRSLPSIVSQSFPCSKIVVVEDQTVDSSAGEVEGICSNLSKDVDYLRNRRTPGAAGAWNTGVDHVARCYEDPSTVFVAFLDDDDSWEKYYLEQALEAVEDHAYIISSPFQRVVGKDPARTVIPPKDIKEADFLVGNPGIQASNLIVRLDKILEAGCFDESLTSCTDRDLCIRLSRLPGCHYTTTNKVGVRHFACADRPRLCTPGSEPRQRGLDGFWEKYHLLMTPEQREKFTARATDYFQWRQTSVLTKEHSLKPALRLKTPELDEAFPLVVGMIFDDRRFWNLEPLLNDMLQLNKDQGLSAIDLLILENSEPGHRDKSYRNLVAKYRNKGLRIHLITRDDVRHAVDFNELPGNCNNSSKQLEIAPARTALQAYLYRFTTYRPGSVVWIIDDDMRLAPLVDAAGVIQRQKIFYLSPYLKELKLRKVDIAIGCYTGAAPLPVSATLRVQLVDLLHNLRWLNTLTDCSELPDMSDQNRQLRLNRRDYYYDLSHIETDRLETPFYLEPAFKGESVAKARLRLEKKAVRILAGEQLFRPLLVNASEFNAFKDSDALHRGGNTFIFNLDTLKDAPNAAPVLQGRPTRRSDMIWALLQKELYQRKVVSIPMGVFHDRTGLSVPEILDVEGITDDIQGFAVFNALQCELTTNEADLEHLVEKYLVERFAAFRLSFYRIQGLAKELLAYAQLNKEIASSDKWQEFAMHILRCYQSERLSEIEQRVQQLKGLHVHEFAEKLDETVTTYREGFLKDGCISEQLLKQREINAIATIKCCHPKVRPLRRLGQGDEGIVFTDGFSVYKVIDYFKKNSCASSKAMLQTFLGQWIDYRHLYPIESVIETGKVLVIQYPYEDSRPYEGRLGPELVYLMNECRRAGVICRNIHPKNLRVTEESLRFIDYGSDLRKVDDPVEYELEFNRMCRRAYLSWRWWFRDDLNALMTSSISNVFLPELEGFEYFMEAINLASCRNIKTEPVIKRAKELKPKRILDYGCGKGEQSRELAHTGCHVVAYDPDPGLRDRLKKIESETLFTTQDREKALTDGPFDLVICRRVACLIDDNALQAVLEDLRAAVAVNGRILFGVCHPVYTPFHTTPEASPLKKGTGDREKSFIWQKKLRSTSRVLNETHRPEHQLSRILMRAGLKVVSRFERMTIDMERFEPIADILVLELESMDKPDTTLLIKACNMDADWIDVLVPHLVKQLEQPSGFKEVLLTIDSKQDGFTRQYAPADAERLQCKALELKDKGWIDRVLFTPESRYDVLKLNSRWFNLECFESHSNKGAPLAPILNGFEHCGTRWLLHADIDIMISRLTHEHDYLEDMRDVLESHPGALTASFNITHESDHPYSSSDVDSPWRTEARIGLIDVDLLKKIRPIPNKLIDDKLELSWHRSVDLAVQNGEVSSWRGGSRQSFFVHPSNNYKQNTDYWLRILTQIENSNVATCQLDQVELTGEIDDWIKPERFERFVFVIGGRNVAPGRFRRCINSVLRQRHIDWGCIVIDDASTYSITQEVEQICVEHKNRITLVKQKKRRGLLAYMVEAIRYRCGNLDSVVITLDADDCLIGDDVLDQLVAEYEAGADVTVGSMLRTDKAAAYPAKFISPRTVRGGNVWQHLRSFRKYLFDAIPDAELQLDGGYIDLANDWAYMLPIIELSRNPRYITKPLYLHEPSGKRCADITKVREEVIARITSRPELKRLGAIDAKV